MNFQYPEKRLYDMQNVYKQRKTLIFIVKTSTSNAF